MVKMENQRINTDALITALRKRDLSLNHLAETLGVSTSSFHRWVNTDKAIPKNLILDIGMRLELDREEMDSFLFVPKYRTYFRRRYLGEVPEDTRKNAIELAKTFLNLSTLHSSAKFCPPDMSSEDNAEQVAECIRRHFAFSQPIDLGQMLTKLREVGVEVGFVRFADFCADSSEADVKEDAFSVTDENRYCIFCNTESVNIGKLPFVVAHELAHLFRVSAKITKAEEQFCNLVAGEIVHPKRYFLDRQASFQAILSSGGRNAQIEMIDQVVDDLGGEFWGVVIRLDQLGFLKPKNKFLLKVGRERNQRNEAIEALFFKEIRSKTLAELSRFWSDSKLMSHPVYHFYSIVKRGIQNERMTPRALSKQFDISFAVAEGLAREWRSQFQHELELSHD